MRSQKMQFACAEQIRAIRNLVALTKSEFSDLTGIPRNRLDNIENKKSRMFAEDVISVAEHFEPFLHWLVLGSDIDMDALKTSQSPILKIAGSMFELGKYPTIFDGKFKSFSKE